MGSNQPDDPSAVLRQVDATSAGVRLDVFLTRQPEIGLRRRAKELVVAGRVSVDGAPAKPGQTLVPGQWVRFTPVLEEGAERGVAGVESVDAPVTPPQVLFEDPFLLVVDKPAGMVAHPPRPGAWNGAAVSSWAKRRCPSLTEVGGADRPGIVHRLDRDTTGVMVLAKTEEAYHFLKGEFRARRVHKEYRAIAFGEARFDSGYLDRAIAQHPNKGDRMVVVDDVALGGREASTYYEVRERFRGFTHFACWPKTGRTHQIRVHLTSIGHSLVGDAAYRSRVHLHAVLPQDAPDPGRQCLHAHRLEVVHPFTREPMVFDAPIPADMAELLRWLRETRTP